jgi:MOSC domain-containing protein
MSTTQDVTAQDVTAEPLLTDRFDEHLAHIVDAPSDLGTVELVVRRPSQGEREVLESAELRPLVGVVGDNYVERGDRRTPDGRADPLGELNIMSSRALAAVAGADRGRWHLPGDQLIVDFDLSLENAPAGTRLAVGTAIIEVTTKPHNGCIKFSDRFGIDAARWINSRKDLRLRGVCAVVVEPGTVHPGDQVRKLPTAPST